MAPYRDPMASISSVPIQFTLNGGMYSVPALSAADWLQVLLKENLTLGDIVPGLLAPGEQDEINMALIRGDVTGKDVGETAEDVLAVATGRDWWIPIRLVAIAGASWDVVGAKIGQLGLDWTSTPFGAWLDVAYLVMREAVAESGDSKTAQSRLTKFISDIERSPVNVTEEIDEEAEAEAFMRAMQMAG